MVDWLIVGGGIHGCVIAQALLRYTGTDRRGIRIIDPNRKPLEAWNRRVAQCGMRYLRSPAAHSVAPDFTSLLAWARAEGWDLTGHTVTPYARPSVTLFRAHASARIAESGIDGCWVRASAEAIFRDQGIWTILLADGRRMSARRVVLAVGRSDRLHEPCWSRNCASHRIRHVFDPNFSLELARYARSPVVVGGGTSAVHLALRLAEQSQRRNETVPSAPVRLISRTPLTVHQFDSDPCYIGPACMARYLSIRDPEERRAVLEAARHPGSIPPDLAREVASAIDEGALEWIEDHITEAREAPGSAVELAGSGPQARVYRTDLVVPATGFAPARPAEGLLQSAMESSAGSLPTDQLGYPIPDSSLQWAPGLYLVGPLAEQELGPSAPNIIGAQNAAKRIIAHLNGAPREIPAAWRRYAPASVSSSSDSC